MEVVGSIKEFNSDTEDWILYQEQLEQYFKANKIMSSKRRIVILLTLLDKQTFEILHNLCNPDLLKDKTYNQLCKLLENHFCQRTSVLKERMFFYSIQQNSDETIDDWQLRIRKVSQKCNFGKYSLEIIIDKFLTGLYNNGIINRICDKEFNKNKKLNEWIRLVLKLERKLKNESFRHGAINKNKNFNTKNKNSIKPINACQNKSVPIMTTLEEQKPYVKIIEQPMSSIRFRYAREGYAENIYGHFCTPEKTTYPKIKVVGFHGKATAVVSCVTSEPPHRPHPYELVGRFECNNGICVMDIPPDTMSLTFTSLGIHYIKKADIAASIKSREKNNIDPYNTGFNFNHESISLNSFRLCFQVFLEIDKRKKIGLSPVISNIIYKQSKNELIITKMSQCVTTVDGSRNDVILLCEEVVKDDIQVRFYEIVEGQLVWESFGILGGDYIHKNAALSFKVPKYKNFDIIVPVTVYMQLQRPSDGETSLPLPFQYYPIHTKLSKYNIFEDVSLQNPNIYQQGSQTQNYFSENMIWQTK